MKRDVKRALAALLGAALLLAPAVAETVELPGGLREIGEEAFLNDVSMREVVVPEGVTAIGARAFAGCENLVEIAIPAATEELGEDFLRGCPEDLLIRTDPGSAAHRYALSQQLDYQADTTYRALLIGQSYRNSWMLDTLEGPPNDVKTMEKCLGLYPGTPYQTTTCIDLTADGIKSAIRRCFGGASEQDVSLFYYSGHGLQSGDWRRQGALIGTDYESITADDLRSVLDEIPGRKIVIIDACYSGNMLSPELASFASLPGEEQMDAEGFVDSFIQAFSRRSRANLAADSYFVITAAARDEPSYEGTFSSGGKHLGIFTTLLAEGCGYDGDRGRTMEKYADENDNGVVTIQEAFDYVAPMLLGQGIYTQHVQVYPSDCRWFGFLRD